MRLAQEIEQWMLAPFGSSKSLILWVVRHGWLGLLAAHAAQNMGQKADEFGH